MAKDEVQYGDPPSTRGPASKHLIEVITGTPHEQRRTDILLDDKTTGTPTPYQTVLTEPGTSNDHNSWTIDDSPLPYPASAAKVSVKHGRKPEDILTHELLLMDITTNIHEPAVSETLPLQGGHPTLGLITEQHPEYTDTITLIRCDPGTISHKQIRRWKSRLRGSTIRMVDDVTITDISQFTETIRLKRLTGQLYVKIQFANPRWSAMSGEGLPTLQFDQLNVITHHLNALNNDGTSWNDPNRMAPTRQRKYCRSNPQGTRPSQTHPTTTP
jgi:hypothetical protein